MKALLAGIVVLTAASGALQAAEWAIAGAINSTEQETLWATELRVQNRDSRTLRLRLTFWSDGSDASSETVDVDLEAGKTVSYGNVLREVWQLENTRGSIRLEADGAATATAFRYTSEREGVLGQALPVIAADEWLSRGEAGDLVWLAETAEWRSSIALYFASPSAKAEVSLFDADGVEIGTAGYDGSVRSRRLPLADLGIQDRAVVRARVRFLSGAGIAAAELHHLPTGDRMGAPAVVVDRGQTDLAVQPAVRNSSFLTSARIFNPTRRTASVRLGWGASSATFDLPPGATREVRDVAAEVGLEGDQQGYLRISSLTRGLKVGALVLLSRRSENGETGPGEFLTPEVTVDVGGAASPMRIPGVPAAADSVFLSLRGGFTASRTEAKVVDREGVERVVTSEPLPLPALDTRLDDLLQINGGPLPEAGSVQLQTLSGEMAPALLGILRGSGDLTHHLPARTIAETPCVAPVIESFSASRPTIDAAGTVTLRWETSHSEGVRLSLDGELRPPRGSFEWTLESTASVTMTAVNDCGESAKSLTVAVGLPKPVTALVNGSAEGGQGRPGQLVQLSLDPLAEPGRVRAIRFAHPSGAESVVEVEGIDTSGRLYAIMPFLWREAPQRYLTGEVALAAEWDDGRWSEPLPFRILPLQPAQDAPAKFRRMLASLKEMAGEADAALRQQGLSSLAESQRAAYTASAAALERLAAELESRGQGSLFLSTAVTGDEAVALTVTRQDVDEWIAYEENLRESLKQLRRGQSPEEASKQDGEPSDVRAAGNTRLAGSCLAAKEPFIPLCKALNFRKQVEAAIADRAADFVHQFADGVPPGLEQQGEKAIRDWVKKRLASITIYGLTKRLQGYLNYLNLVCLVRPIELDHFYLITRPPRRGTSAQKEVMYSQYDNQPTLIQVNALLKPHWDANKIRDEISKREAKFVAKQLAKLKVPTAVGEQIMRFLQQLGQDDAELKAIEAAAKALNFKTDQPYQVGKCDLRSFFPAPGLRESHKSAVRIAPGFVQGEDDFYYIGRKIHSRARMCIEPFEANFIFSDRVLARDPNLNASGCPFSDQVVTRGLRAAGEPAFPAPGFSDDVHVGPGEGILRAGAWTGASNNFTSARPSGHNPTLTEVSDTAPWLQESSAGPARARVVIRKTGRNKWEIEGSADGQLILITPSDVINYTANLTLNTSLSIPETSSGQYTLRMESSAEASAGVCGLSLSLSGGGKVEGGSNSQGGFVSPSSPRSLRYNLEVRDQPGPAALSIGLFATTSASASNHPSACRAKGAIELVLPEP